MDKIKIAGAITMIVGLGLIITGIVVRIEHGPTLAVYGNILGGFCIAITGSILSFVD